MTSNPSESSPPRPPIRRRFQHPRRRKGSTRITVFLLLAAAWFMVNSVPNLANKKMKALKQIQETVWVSHPEPLAMQGGDPYIRALMRTISAAESNTSEPYSILYGGDVFKPLNRHPDICVPIVTGPNVGNCTTAAGRYQFLFETWEEKAQRYHPNKASWFGGWGDYSFDPKYQDLVVYHWLKDSSAWGVDISTTLREGRLDDVLKRLSGTWTSLGYGIESNSMTARLPRIYENLLEEELGNAPSGAVPRQGAL